MQGLANAVEVDGRQFGGTGVSGLNHSQGRKGNQDSGILRDTPDKLVRISLLLESVPRPSDQCLAPTSSPCVPSFLFKDISEMGLAGWKPLLSSSDQLDANVSQAESLGPHLLHCLGKGRACSFPGSALGSHRGPAGGGGGGTGAPKVTAPSPRQPRAGRNLPACGW